MFLQVIRKYTYYIYMCIEFSLKPVFILNFLFNHLNQFIYYMYIKIQVKLSLYIEYENIIDEYFNYWFNYT